MLQAPCQMLCHQPLSPLLFGGGKNNKKKSCKVTVIIPTYSLSNGKLRLRKIMEGQVVRITPKCTQMDLDGCQPSLCGPRGTAPNL